MHVIFSFYLFGSQEKNSASVTQTPVISNFVLVYKYIAYPKVKVDWEYKSLRDSQVKRTREERENPLPIACPFPFC